jgi:hypothetical protein
MTTPTLGRESADYLRAVGAALADLPDDEREEMVDDLRSHLAEIASETDDPPTARLGPPEEYAAELRAAAGIGPAQGGSPKLGIAERTAALGRRFGTAVRALPGGPALLEFLPQLRPAWWVLRGYLFTVILTAVFTGASFDGPLPQDGSAAFVFLVFALAFVVVSVWIGRHPPRRPARVLALRAASVLLVLMGFALWLASGSSSAYPASYDGAPYDQYDGSNLGTVTDIRPYDAAGRPLRDVQLFDQDGNPIQLPSCDQTMSADCVDRVGGMNVYPRSAPGAVVPSAEPTAPSPSAPSATSPTAPSPTARSTP